MLVFLSNDRANIPLKKWIPNSILKTQEMMWNKSNRHT